jgi:hypothetical protein
MLKIDGTAFARSQIAGPQKTSRKTNCTFACEISLIVYIKWQDNALELSCIARVYCIKLFDQSLVVARRLTSSTSLLVLQLGHNVGDIWYDSYQETTQGIRESSVNF